MSARPFLFALVMAGSLGRASELHWQNGESVGGHFVGAEAGHVIWRSPMFNEDFQVRLDVLRRINRFKTDSRTDEPFSIRLADGSLLYGSITALDSDTLTLKSARAGSIRVLRGAVVGVQRLKVAGSPFVALAGTSGWTESTTENAQPDKEKLWRMVPGAALHQVGWNRSAHLPVEIPARVEMQFTLSSTERPEFKIELKAREQERVIVETWIDDVVLQGRVFEKVQKLASDSRRITLTLFWDRDSRLAAIYGADGSKLAETRLPAVDMPESRPKAQDDAEEKKPAGGGGIFGALVGAVQGAVQARAEAAAQAQQARVLSPSDTSPIGLSLLNKGPDLTLESLRIRPWDGRLPTDITSARPRIELIDGRHLKATAIRADTSSVTVREHGGRETRLPWESVLTLEMAQEPSPFYQASEPLVEMWFTDGEWVNGTLIDIRNEVAAFQTTFSTEPVHFKISALHHLDFKGFHGSGQDLAALDKLTAGKTTLHGTLDAGGGPQPRWLPVGGLSPVTLVSAGEMEITRSAQALSTAIHRDALFYLQQGDVLPGRLRAMDAKHVDLDSDVSQAKHLDPARLLAVQFGGTALNLDGFEDPGWQRLRGSAENASRSGSAALVLKPGGSWGHPSFMQVHEISFSLQNTGFSTLRVRLFTDGVDRSSLGTNLVFAHMGAEICFGLETTGDQMDRQFRLRTTSGSMPVRISVADNTVEVFFNNVSARKIVLTSKMRSGSGIIIEPCNLWNNGEREVHISDFRSRLTPGRVAPPIVNALAREQALTVPRFRKDDPPRHALIAANGDLLRGVIEAATSDHFAIRSGLETVQVPRDRVKAVVWLIKPVDAVSAAFEDRDSETAPPLITHWLLLSNGGRLGLKVDRFAPEGVFGTSPLLGACQVPFSQLYSIRSTSPPDSASMLALRDWKLKFAPEPVLPESGGQSSPLLNQDAKPFKLPLLSGEEFDLSEEKGKVIVLDFWATWCGPCIKSLPQMIDAMSAFDPKQVRFIGVNQAEDKEAVKTFLDTRSWKFEVALDSSQRVGQSFGVEGIPHTVVIGPDGKVAYVKTGYEPDGAAKIAEAIRKLLKK